MKGVVFTEFMEMVETQFSLDTLDQVIEQAALPNQGAYTAVGTYDHAELVRMVVALSGLTGVPAGDLVKAFGRYMFGRFFTLYPRFFEGVPDAITFLSGIEDVIHAEVIKLYPDAQLPRFDCHHVPDGLDMVYHSPRHFEDLALGLLEGALAHWGGGYSVTLQTAVQGGALFKVRRLAGVV